MPPVQALLFDVFGTVVDWRGSIIAEGQASGLSLDWPAFADRWRAGYLPAMHRVRTGELPWTNLDHLHRMLLEDLLRDFGVTLTDSEKEHWNRVWHRLRPWPDAVPALARLKQRYTIAPLSNGNVALLTNLAKHAGLPWDVILSAELAHHYKPDPEVYLTAAALLNLHPGEAMMVAAHRGDLQAARACGLRTAFVRRLTEYGGTHPADTATAGEFDLAASDFTDLAIQLEA